MKNFFYTSILDLADLNLCQGKTILTNVYYFF